MPHLSIRVLGPLQVDLDGEPASGFASDKVRALLAYLASSADRPHRRETIAGLLWPDFPERSARNNLRNALANLRRVIADQEAAPGFLHITRQTIQFCSESDYQLDSEAFEALISGNPPGTARLEEAVALVQGAFLEGFTLTDAAPFEEWLLMRRERFGRQLLDALENLAILYEAQGAYQRALAHARRRVDLEPWDEGGQRRLMRLLAWTGRPGEALAQYGKLRQSLRQDLDIEPAVETMALFEQIRVGGLPAPEPVPVQRPSRGPVRDSLGVGGVDEAEAPLFVAREPELAVLDECLVQALSGRSQIVFVTGEAGSGKTALLRRFVQRANADQSALIAARGACNAYTGAGDPYLPFRQILEQLTGGEFWPSTGSVRADRAPRLRRTLSLAVRAVVEVGPDLIGTLVDGHALADRAKAYSVEPSPSIAWARLQDTLERGPGGAGPRLAPGSMASGHSQGILNRQYTRVLEAVAQAAPLVLTLDDLQWADGASIELLLELSQSLAGNRLLVVGAYRPEDVALGRDGRRHPLLPAVHHIQRLSGQRAINLDDAEGRAMVEALLDSEPNRLGVPFRDRLYGRTQGHALFTIELLRALQERGQLVRDSAGNWVEAGAVDWGGLPARIEAVIEERISRLPEPLRTELRVASVEGETFTAEVLATVLGVGVGQVVEHFSSELGRRHRLVRAAGTSRSPRKSGGEPGQQLSRYRFRHILFQRYLHTSLDSVERAHLHRAVGEALEGLHGSETGYADPTMAPQLAYHFQEAGVPEKAVRYLHQAGARAVEMSAYADGIGHLTKGLSLLAAIPDSAHRARLELSLQLALGIAWIGHKAYGPQAEQAYTRARVLSERLEERATLCLVLSEMAVFQYVRGQHWAARDLAGVALDLAEECEDEALQAIAHWVLGFVAFTIGECGVGRDHLERVVSYYDPGAHHGAFVSLRGSDVGASALAHDACCLWELGLPEEALARSRQALRVARELDHALTLADVVCYGGCLPDFMRRDASALADHAEELMRVSREAGFHGFWATGRCFEAIAQSWLGQPATAVERLREGLSMRQSRGVRCHESAMLGALAEALAAAGRPQEGLDTLAQALELAEETGEEIWKGELRRLRGEIRRCDR
jgi:DNA-binding SARP family transcriptional activator/predicted ATPase